MSSYREWSEQQTRQVQAELEDERRERFGPPQPVRSDYKPLAEIDWTYYSPERVAARNAAATLDRLNADADAFDLGYSAVHTAESWETLLATVTGLVRLTAAELEQLRAGWEAAQDDAVDYAKDMVAGVVCGSPADGDREFPF